MDNNLRTVKQIDLINFVNEVLDHQGVRSVVSYHIYSFYIEFHYSISSNDFSLAKGIWRAFSELYNRGIITEKPIEDNFKAYETEHKTLVTFIHPFNIVD